MRIFFMVSLSISVVAAKHECPSRLKREWRADLRACGVPVRWSKNRVSPAPRRIVAVKRRWLGHFPQFTVGDVNARDDACPATRDRRLTPDPRSRRRAETAASRRITRAGARVTAVAGSGLGVRHRRLDRLEHLDPRVAAVGDAEPPSRSTERRTGTPPRRLAPEPRERSMSLPSGSKYLSSCRSLSSRMTAPSRRRRSPRAARRCASPPRGGPMRGPSAPAA